MAILKSCHAQSSIIGGNRNVGDQLRMWDTVRLRRERIRYVVRIGYHCRWGIVCEMDRIAVVDETEGVRATEEDKAPKD